MNLEQSQDDKISSDDNHGFEKGYQFFQKHFPDFISASHNSETNGEYIGNIDDRIQQLKSAIETHGNNAETNNGFMAEYWGAGTYNIDAAVKRSSSSARVADSPLERMVKGGADIITSEGQEIGSKYDRDAYHTQKEQSKTILEDFKKWQKKHPDKTGSDYFQEKGFDANTDLYDSLYKNQARLVPSDQLEDCIKAINKRIDKESNNLANPGRAKLVKSLIETRDNLTDHIQGPNGEQSYPLTLEQSKQLRDCAKEGRFDPRRYGLEAANLADRAYLLQNCVQSGLRSAKVSAMLTMLPELIKLIGQAYKEGEITTEDLISLAKKGCSGASLGFIRGFLCAYAKTSIELGYWGEALKHASKRGSFDQGIATFVSLAISILGDSIDLRRGLISKEEFGYRVDRSVYIAAFSYVSGSTLQSIFVEFPLMAYMVGSFIGSLIGGLTFDFRENFIMGLCVVKGWTFWGLVDQDYSLPPGFDDLTDLDLTDIHMVDNDEVSLDEIHIDEVPINLLCLDEVDIEYVRRGVISIRRVGYMPA